MTTTVSTPAKTPSPAFGKFALVFGITFVVTYVVCDVTSTPLFTFFPATGHFAWGREPAAPSSGPAMYWYGWVVNCFIVSSITGLLATLLPDSVAKRIPLWLTWLLPVLAVPLLLYTLMPLLNHR